jgi:A/G-specific adenine glycosylase
VNELALKIIAWFCANARDLPWRRTLDPYPIWVSEIMLQQTQVKTVIPYWERWMREFPTIQELAKASPERVLKMWEGLGYYSRARNLHRAAQIIDSFPREYATVLALPGIGPYTAGAICSIAFNEAVPILDGNVARVLARLFVVALDPKSSAGKKKFWSLAEALVKSVSGIRLRKPLLSGACSALNQGLMELGALICTPRNPSCQICPVSESCAARRRGNPEAYPRQAARPKTIVRHFLVLVIARGSRFLVRQRPANVVNGGFWEFPNFELLGNETERRQRAAKILKRFRKAEPILPIYKQSITRYRITLEPYVVSSNVASAKGAKWLTLDQMQALAFAGAHRRILRDVSPSAGRGCGR